MYMLSLPFFSTSKISKETYSPRSFCKVYFSFTVNSPDLASSNKDTGHT